MGGSSMVVRYRSKDGINVFPESDCYLLCMPNEIDFDGMLGDEEHTHILVHRLGIGKTYNVMKLLKEKANENKEFKFFYFTDIYLICLQFIPTN